MSKLDCGTTESEAFAGPIGTRLTGRKNLLVALFEPMPVSWTLEIKNTENLSTDEKYLFDNCAALSTGKCSRKLDNRMLRLVVQLRWITTACRILLLYVNSSNPEEAVKYLALYVIHVYAQV